MPFGLFCKITEQLYLIPTQVWFSAQRLKHGVSWTPEEVEEARRKQFNGTVHTVPQTITVIPAHQLSAAANGLQSILQTCQIVGQPGLVFTQVGKEWTRAMSTETRLWPLNLVWSRLILVVFSCGLREYVKQHFVLESHFCCVMFDDGLKLGAGVTFVLCYLLIEC